MPSALPLTDRISQSSSKKRTNRVIRCQFGDGYEQVRPDGINNLVDTWELGFESLNSTDRGTLQTFLDAIGAWDYFTWTPPGEASSKKFKVVDGYQEQPQSGSLYSITFTAKQFF
ncbi:phage tail protein [Variovorax sp. J22R193]|uniref:phage tail protein n=1 Tax=Variovorax fucosicus TaxID=3053517 RepID=UPI002577B101|nr:phage tail protein [Variovorax sp. J22R193]MDM0042149.1 phage tail protein [Variovorax sp. J22R193]